MNVKGVVLIAIAAFVLGSCRSNPTTGVQPEIIRPLDVYVHAPSGMRFPTEIEEFQRAEIVKYDAAGLDVSAGYNLKALKGGIAATVYIYPAPSLVSVGSPVDVVASARATLCKSEFERRKSEVASVHPGAKLTMEKEIPFPHGGPSTMGRMAAFEIDGLFGGQRQLLQSELYVFCPVGQRWVLKYRFTSPKDFDARDRISKFMAKLPWPLSSI